MSLDNWTQFKLIVTEPPRYTEHFNLIRNEIIPFISENSIPFWVTNYWDPNEDYILFRVRVDERELNVVNNFLDNLIERALLIRYETSNWTPHSDAESRIAGLSERIRGYNPNIHRIEDFTPEGVVYAPDTNIDERQEQLSALFESLGECTKAVYTKLSSKPKDKWIMSLFIHLLLNSLDFSGPNQGSEESRIRRIPVY